MDTDEDGYDARPGNGHCSTALLRCSLRAAVEEANALGGKTYIELAADDYILTEGDLDIESDVAIRGRQYHPPHGNTRRTIIDPEDSRHFHVRQGGKLYLDTLILQSGGAPYESGDGGAVLNEGRFDARHIRIRDNGANVSGAGIYNAGTLHLAETHITGNHCTYGGGCGIYNAEGATATLFHVLVAENSAFRGTSGAGIYNAGELTITESEMRDNLGINGDNIRNDEGATLTIQGSTFVSPDQFAPGGIVVDGPPEDLRDEGGNERRYEPVEERTP